MKKLEFSLPMNFEKIKITGRPVKMWNCKESCKELYEILYNHLPHGTFDELSQIITTEKLAQNCKIEDLKEFRDVFKQRYNDLKKSQDIPEKYYESGELLSALKLYFTLEMAIEIKKRSKC